MVSRAVFVCGWHFTKPKKERQRKKEHQIQQLFAFLVQSPNPLFLPPPFRLRNNSLFRSGLPDSRVFPTAIFAKSSNMAPCIPQRAPAAGNNRTLLSITSPCPRERERESERERVREFFSQDNQPKWGPLTPSRAWLITEKDQDPYHQLFILPLQSLPCVWCHGLKEQYRGWKEHL